ncbi:MAG: DUF4185 domain-containing protein [Chloroflexi bacterium]|nr:MAG: DUF4185 domain-containing protein [Chloroflexota bacterium]
MMETRWPSTPPSDCPFPPSEQFDGLIFTGRHAEYTHADTWYPSWASDDNLYSPWTDGNFEYPRTRPFHEAGAVECSSKLDNPANAGKGDKSGTGQAKIIGDDPLNLKLVNLGIHYASPLPYGGRYPCGSLVYDGVWYYGTYCLDETDRGLNWDVLGPFVGFRISRDYGLTWEECPHTPASPIFGESGKNGAKVKIGAPHFVDFGKNMAYSPDGKAYLVGHGATRPDAELAWIAGDQAYLIRVTPAPENMNDPAKYEFFAGHDASGEPIWSLNFSEIKPLIEWNGRVGHVTITYNPPLQKYLMCVTDGWPTISTMNTFLLESDAITGPWRLITFMEKFGEQGYFVNIPSKFIGADGETFWLCYSANFTNQPGVFGTRFEANPPGSRYGMCLQEVRLQRRT